MTMVFLKKIPKKYRIIGACCGFFIAIAGIGGWIIMPYLVDKLIDLNVILYKDSEQFERWHTLPQPMEFRVFIFNVTNANDIPKGALPIVQEIGPYVYKQYRIKNVEKISKDQMDITYTSKQIYKFDRQLSYPRRENDKIVVLNVAMNAVLQISEDIANSQLGLINNYIFRIFPNQSSLYIQTTPKQYFFDGVSFCLKGDEIQGLVCKIVEDVIKRRQIRAIRRVNDGSFKFAFFYYKNNTHDGQYKILSGFNDSTLTSRILTWEGKPHLALWTNETKSISTCNLFKKATDGVLFPPHLKPEGSVNVYVTDICRAVQLYYRKTITYQKIIGYRFETGDDFLKKIGSKYSTKCFCITRLEQVPKYDDGCLYKGALDLSLCHGAPIILSMPHMTGAAPEYQTVRGLKPDLERAKIYVDIEPNTGYPLRGYKRAQLNMFVRKVDKIDFTKNLKTVLMPIVWVEEGTQLNDKMIKLLNDKMFTPLLIANILIYAAIGSGLTIFFVCLIQLWTRPSRRNVDKIVAVRPMH
uniref:Sensory neuron membrane protein 2 n=1 Tax=Bradysia odoriphaga TaxID=1564500 RepID=A0A6B9C9K9_9DIPT|nr:sensory neuron membrane protein 2 [Bradysia odoriphaga]